MKRVSIVFTAPRQVELIEEPLEDPAPDQALVQTLYSAISPGTELMIYRGEFPDDFPLDDTIPSLAGSFSFPLRYGYACVGQVIAIGKGVPGEWEGRLVFSFQPHASHFLAKTQELLRVPEDIPAQRAALLPSMETAVSLCMDGAPVLGERVAVFGQGMIGLLTTALLAHYPLECLVSLDCHALRRRASIEAGASASLDADAPDALEQIRQSLGGSLADLVYELSGSPAALDQAIASTAYSGRVVIGSWYGKKRAALDLGGRFHRSRIRLVSSQVSRIAPELSGMWTKERRFEVAWAMLRRIQPEHWITHVLPVGDAPKAYRLLDERPGEAIQVVLRYG
jgi:2-desacetyl-2-hydroxyethyl bacteriochlorophyllide A dehydrogenase